MLDDYWGDVRATIELDIEQFGPDALRGLDEFSHLEVVYLLHKVDEQEIVTTARRPRDRPDLPLVGIFADRSKYHSNRIGASRCKILAVRGTNVEVEGLDAVDGTPILDLKPWVRELAPRVWIRQPDWVFQVLQNYYKKESERPKPGSSA